MCIHEYQLGMGCVNQCDQIHKTGVGLCCKTHLKTWYNKSYFVVCDFMILNSYISPNMAATGCCTRKNKLAKHHFYAILAEEMTIF